MPETRRRIVLFGLLLPVLPRGAAWADPAASFAEQSDFAERAEALIRPYARAGIFSGAVIVARNGMALFRQAYGAANREWSVPNTAETRFRIASLTKQFTAAAILRLREAGRLGLDDSASRHMPGLPAAWTPITLRMLLDHTSGLPNVTALPDFPTEIARTARNPMDVVARLFPEDLLFPAGTAQEYSNTGYILLAAIVERITGEPFAEALRSLVLAPAGLSETGDADPDLVIPRRASGYRRVAGAWRNAGPVVPAAALGAGGLVSTLDDLVAWDQALLAGRVLAPESLAEMVRDRGHGYGLGLYLGHAYGQRLWSHGGFLNGFSAIKDTYPDLGLTVVVLGNTETAPAQTLSRRLAALALGVPEATEIAVPPGVIERYVGFYRTGPRAVVALTRSGDRLVVQGTGLARLELTPESDRVFVAGDGTRIALDIEPDGRATGLLVDAAGGARSGPRIDAQTARRITSRRLARLIPR
ncbi:serine hydrolase domain-containing protein [Methylobacterium sp. J-068]|uniref:serine hydrolase domain-containing protein n=1 Tax=Methylobacterium sp. J-068 TaxID=2836649 RepID=UPI001FBBF6CB|nr:serine hydrolase domain-containing protein [Methylobacterium sp. J-068]MCJ2037190.1 serine hydrolase [Methylobacterium sp. J-068]